MKSSSDILYSKSFYDLSDICVIDENVIKNRGRDLSETNQDEIMERALKFENVVIQEESAINIYCSKEQKTMYEYEINRFPYIKNMSERGYIKIHTETI